MTDRPIPLGLLDVLVGEWTQEITGHGNPTGTMSFEWALDGRYLLQRSDLPTPFPQSFSVIDYDEPAGEFRQHYFDSRGVSRLYRMTVHGSTWTLWRNEPDFSVLAFAQRFTAEISEDGRAVDGRWEKSFDGGDTWEHDFRLRLERRP